MSSLALNTAWEIQGVNSTEEQKVLVFDFLRGSEGTSSQLGTILADRLSESLSNLSKSMKVMDRKILTDYLEKNWMSQEDLSNEEVCLWIGRRLGATGVITGSLSEENGQITLKVHLAGFGPVDNKANQFAPHDELAHLTLTEQTKRMLSQSGPSYAHKSEDIPDEPGVLKTGTPGVSQPRCVKCPDVQYSDYARTLKFHGTVRLSVIVTAEGKITSIYILRGAPFLNAEAIKTIQTWQLHPAEQDGRPVPVRTEFEIKFHLD
ncbi:MAG TPA: energy transducer TonB [Candidatus Acidoferrum sp.]